jgi:hypothetical protein
MKNYEMVGYDSPEEGAVKMILSYIEVITAEHLATFGGMMLVTTLVVQGLKGLLYEFFALDNYGEYSDEDIDDIYKRFLANKEWLRKERE